MNDIPFQSVWLLVELQSLLGLGLSKSGLVPNKFIIKIK